MNSIELRQRTKTFAIRVLSLIDHLPRTIAGRSIASQLCRSATSVAANYRASCRARSRAEFIAKIGVVEEEADESAFWLELIVESLMLPESKVKSLKQEAVDLTAIMAASRKTAKRTSQSAIGNRQSAIP